MKRPIDAVIVLHEREKEVVYSSEPIPKYRIRLLKANVEEKTR